jgi:hypothetical protein
MNNKKVHLKCVIFVLIFLLTGACGLSQVPAPPPIPIDKKLAPGDWEWLSYAGIPAEQMTRALKQIRQLPGKEAKKTAGQLRAAWEKASKEGKHAACLLMAAALEQAGEKNLALITYRKIKKESKGLPYAKSAAFRLRLSDNPKLAKPKKLESLYKDIFKQGDGWFFVPEKTWITPHEAAQYLLQLHNKELSFRFFNYLRSNSPFSQAYSYLFILLVLTIGIKVLELPLYAKVMKYSNKLHELWPDIQHIRYTASGPSEAQKQTNQLLLSHGVSPASGSAIFIVDIIFWLWAFYTLESFSPQFTLDGAKFLWTPDIMQRSIGILIAWVVISMIYNSLSVQARAYGSPGALAFSAFLVCTIFSVVGWFAKWQAYVFIFLMLLNTADIILNLVFHVVHRLRRYKY